MRCRGLYRTADLLPACSMSDDSKHWGDTAFGLFAGFALFALAIGLAFAAVFASLH